MWCENLKVLVFDSSYQCNMSLFTLDSARKLGLLSLHQPWTSQHVGPTYVYSTVCNLLWAAGWCEYVRLNRVRVEPFASVVPHLLLGMPWGASISPKVPKSR